MRTCCALIMLLLLAGCSREPDAELIAESVYGYAPLAASAPAVAYFTLRNPGTGDVRIDAISSETCGKAELHETRIDAGVASMRPVADARVPAAGELRLEPGGLHVMLMPGDDALAAGTRCELSVRYAGDRELTIEVDLLPRGTGLLPDSTP